MYYVLKPKKGYHGKNLKKWYRRVTLALIGQQRLPMDWASRPTIEVPADKLSAVMNSLHDGNFILNF